MCERKTLKLENHLPDLLVTHLGASMNIYHLNLKKQPNLSRQLKMVINRMMDLFSQESEKSYASGTVGEFLEFYENFSLIEWQAIDEFNTVRINIAKKFIQKLREVAE